MVTGGVTQFVIDHKNTDKTLYNADFMRLLDIVFMRLLSKSITQMSVSRVVLIMYFHLVTCFTSVRITIIDYVSIILSFPEPAIFFHACMLVVEDIFKLLRGSVNNNGRYASAEILILVLAIF